MMGDGMSEMNEEKITKCLEALGRIDSNPEQVGRDMERTRQRILEEIARPQTHPDNLWRKVMKSNLIKFAIAAIVMIAAVAGFFWMGDGATLAWAEVAARVMERVLEVEIRMAEGLARLAERLSTRLATGWVPPAGLR